MHDDDQEDSLPVLPVPEPDSIVEPAAQESQDTNRRAEEEPARTMTLEDVRVLTVHDVPTVMAILERGYTPPEKVTPWRMDFHHIRRNLEAGLSNGEWTGYFHQYGMLAGTLIPCFHFNRSVRRATVVYSAVQGPFERLAPLIEAWDAWARASQATHITMDFMQAGIGWQHEAFDHLMQKLGFDAKWHEWSRALV